MKRTILIAILLTLTLFLTAQTLLLDPNGDGGFENGTTLAANGWTLGSSALNTWYTGSVPAGMTGQRGAYVSTIASGGSNWTYSNPSTGGATTIMYRDISFPAGETDIRLSFDYISGQSAYDGVSLILAPIDYSWGFSDYSYFLATKLNRSKQWTHISFKIDPSYAGTTKRLQFRWQCLPGTVHNPPFAIDNIKVSSGNASPLGGSYTIDNTQPTSGSNFKYWGDAVMSLNAGGINAPVTFNVAPGQSFYENLPVITRTGTLTNPIEFRKDPNLSGTNPKLLSPGYDDSYLVNYDRAIITLIGADYYSFNGIDMENYASSGLFDNTMFAVQLLNNGSADGCQNIAVRNGTISLSGSVAIIQHNILNGVSAASGAHSYNTFENLYIHKATAGILMYSPSSVYPDLDCVVRHNVLGSETAGSLNGFGIYVNNGHGASIHNNTIRNLTVSVNSPTEYPAAISVLNWDNVGSRTLNIYNNKISTISTNAVELNGILVHQRYSGEVRIYNNTIHGLRNNSTNSMSFARGISLQDYSNSGGVVTFHVDFNTLIFDSDNYTAMNWEGISFGHHNSKGDIYNVRNNIIAFYGTNRQRSALNSDEVLSAINPASVIDHNVYYSAVRGTSFSIYEYSQRVLYAWTALSGFDAHSRMEDPRVVAYNDLHIRTDVPTPVEGGGSFFGGTIPWAQYDIDGNRTLRNSETPDIGAYEGGYVYYPRPSGAGIPTYTNPANGATGLNTTGWNYQWTAPTGSVIGYQIYLGTNNPPTNIQNAYELGNVLQYTYYSHQNNTTYYWKVVAYNDYGASNSPVWSFTTLNPYPDPSTPVYPPLNSTTVPVSGWNFSWLAPVYTGGSSIQQYMFALYEMPSMQQIISMQMLPGTTLSYPMGTLLKYNTDYRWMATPLNASWQQPQGGTNFIFRTTTVYQNTLPVDNGEPDPPAPTVQIPSLTGLYDFNSWAEWQPAGVDISHSGLGIYVRGNYQGRRIEINPDLGYVPERIVYRVQGGSLGWQLYEAQPDWTPSLVYVWGPMIGKANGDLEILFQGGDQTLPVVLASFTATPTAQNNAVTLNWITHSETNLTGFYVFRNVSPNLGSALNLNTLIPATNSSLSQNYGFVDQEVPGEGTYYYWLNSLEMDGSSQFFGPISVTLTSDQPIPPEIPLQTVLRNVFPNPFNPSTTFAYSIKEPCTAQIRIFNQRGQSIYQHSQIHSVPGHYQHTWNAPALASGVYHMVFTAGKYSTTRKVVLMK